MQRISKMKILLTSMITATCVLLVAVAGCARQQTPRETQADVAKAQAQGAKDVAKAQNEAGEKMADASDDVNKAQRKAAVEDAAATGDVTLAEAKATHYVSIERCEGLMDDTRAACKSTADARLAEAKARAATIKANGPAT
jgi:hypothetical protein